MKIDYARNISFCDGVKRAYQMVEKLALEKKESRIFILGSLAHNESVTQRIQEMGVKKIKSLRNVRRGDWVIITAHGDRKKTFESIRKKGAFVFDATCPKVIKVQKIVEYYSKKGFKVLIFGDKDHKEVKGINGWCENDGLVFQNVSQVKDVLKKLDQKNCQKAVVVSQTTQNVNEFKKATGLLPKKMKKIMIFDTICRATQLRQQEAAKMSKSNDLLVVIGGKESGNTKRLYQICRKNNPNSVWISQLGNEEKKKIEKRMKKASSIGVISGASTPFWQIEEVDIFLKNC
jgi:small subunit ribosomal protein S1